MLRTVFWVYALAVIPLFHIVLSVIPWLPFWAIQLIAMPIGSFYGLYMMSHFDDLEAIRKPYEQGNVGQGYGVSCDDTVVIYLIVGFIILTTCSIPVHGPPGHPSVAIGPSLLEAVHRQHYGLWLLGSILAPTMMTALMLLIVQRDRLKHPRQEGQQGNETE